MKYTLSQVRKIFRKYGDKVKYIRRIVIGLLLAFFMNLFGLSFYMKTGKILIMLLAMAGAVFFTYINFFPSISIKKETTPRNKILSDGAEILKLFLFTTGLEIIYTIVFGIKTLPQEWGIFLGQLLIIILAEAILFWNGIIRVYITSVQLGIKWRVIGVICGWIPIAHLYALLKIIQIVSNEVEYETEKFELNKIRVENYECRTKYPLLLVHGVFFRDFRFFNYWGRIPGELIKNGATVYYGQQQSAASVEECGKELTARIHQIVQETGCEKVNIIAHSKGGLDSRYAISCAGAAPYVASLTTINTPHRGCIFADYLLEKIPKKVCNTVSKQYNSALKQLGDSNPDFMEAVTDLTATACEKRNETLKDHPDVFYQSIGTKMNRATSGKFPLNMSYPLVKHFDGENDGLVAVDSAEWGEKFTYIAVKSGRGISHGDVIDLNRENIKDFDVREFYVKLVKDLKDRGF